VRWRGERREEGIEKGGRDEKYCRKEYKKRERGRHI